MSASKREEEDRSRVDGFEMEIFKLVQREATSEQWKEWLRAPLEHAAAEGNLDLFTRLMDAGANGQAGWRGCDGRTLLGAAAFGESDQMVRALLEAGAKDDVNVLFGGESQSALHVAAARGADDSCKALMIAGADPNLRDLLQLRPLHLAAAAGHHRVVGSLLLNKADVDAKTSSAWQLLTPLHLAASNGQVLCISELLLGGADKDDVDRIGRTPLFKAAENNHRGAVEKLLAAGANYAMRANCNRSPLDIAARKGLANIVKVFLDKDNNQVDATDGDGWTALHHAAYDSIPALDKGDAVRVLLGAGAAVNVKTTSDAFTPLHLAVKESRRVSEGTIRALLEGGGNVHARDFDDETPLHTASSWSSVTGVEILLRWGAGEKLTNKSGDTPADIVGAWGLVYDEVDADDQRIDRMLARAPADRSWRRRGLLVLSRSCPTRVQIANRGESGSSSSSSSGTSRNNNGSSAKVARVGGEVSSRDDEETQNQMMADLRDLVGRLVGLEADGLFRLVVGFL